MTLPAVRRLAPRRSTLVAVSRFTTGLAVLLLVISATLATATGARAADTDSVNVLLTSIEPLAPAPGGDLVVQGTLRVGKPFNASRVVAQLRVGGSALGTRSQVADYESGRGLADGGVRTRETYVLRSAPVSGTEVPFKLSVSLDSLSLGRFGVYPMAVEVTDGRSRLGITRTFLTWTPTIAQINATPIAWLWPVTDVPARDAEGTWPGETSKEFSDSLAPDGRLGRLVAAGTGKPVLWMVDPQVLEAASALAKGPVDRESGGSLVRRSPDAHGDSWLNSIRTATQSAGPSGVTALPYADPDLTAVHHAGRDGTVDAANALGRSITAQTIGVSAETEPAWPVAGRADTGTLDALAGLGYSRTVLSSAVLGTRSPLTYTPSAVARLTDSGRTVWVTDDVLDEVVARDTRAAGSLVPARQRFLAETAMITAERPGDPRTILVAPPRLWDPQTAWADALMAATTSTPWLAVQTPEQLRSAVPRPPTRRGPDWSETDRAAEVPASQLATLSRVASGVDTFAGVLTDSTQFHSSFSEAMLRGNSSAWRKDRPAGQAFADNLASQLSAIESKVSLLSRGQVSLSSRSGRIPVTVSNALTQDVTVRIKLVAKPAIRLKVHDPGPVTVKAGRSFTVEVPAEASANGVIKVEAQLLSPDGAAFGRSVKFDVRATAYGKVATAIVGGALALLFVAVAIRIVRRLALRHGGPVQGEAERPTAEVDRR